MLSSNTPARPEPVLDAAKVAAAVSGTVTAIGTAFVLVGWTTAETVNNWAVVAGGIVTAVGTLITVALPIITALGARAQVTPLAAPLGVDGVPLITTAVPLAAVGEVEITDALRELVARDRPPVPPPTSPIAPGWRPPTPAAVAAEPTPIADDAEAATTGRIPAVTD